mmetsp:Transcript_3127/g.3970  ORF Transcript_3127/g.3970 Transcript_3127/m.3970 type:complete len:216 (-) Transcript_3127:163-810(-)
MREFTSIFLLLVVFFASLCDVYGFLHNHLSSDHEKRRFKTHVKESNLKINNILFDNIARSLQSSKLLPAESDSAEFSLATDETPQLPESIVDNEFQLEEFEDQETSETTFHIESDGSVRMGGTTGPMFESADVSFKYDPANGSIEFDIVRHFDGYSVARSYLGNLEEFIGTTSLIFGGKIIVKDDIFGDMETGYFKMITCNQDFDNPTMKVIAHK